MKELTAVVLGYGDRGGSYAVYAAKHPEELDIVAIAEPGDARREHAQKLHNLSDDMVFTDWKQIAEMPKFADFAIIATQDKMHTEPALAMIEKGYNLLLEKPMAPTPEECKIITEAAEKKGVKVVVCHVLRYTPFWRKLKDIIDDGEIGEIMSIIHMENVGNLHQSHSFVRGNWRRKDESTPMILAKCCHDTDILQWLIGKPCKKVHSFGSLTHFTKENKPEGAPARCTDGCPHVDTCFYDAVWQYCECQEWDSIYRRKMVTNKPEPTIEDVMEALKTGPYGRCVYDCDNDVVDHQVVNMEFEGGCTVSFTMSAFNKGARDIRIFGTKGEIIASMEENKISIFSFATRETKEYQLEKMGLNIDSGHGGGDEGIMRELISYFNGEEPSKSINSARTSYLNHLISFAAEDSRLSNTVIDIDEYAEAL